MASNKPSSDNVLTMPRRGPLTHFTEVFPRRTDAPASWRESDFQSRPQRDVATRTLATGSALKTRGEIEAAVCAALGRFELEHLGRGPKVIRAHLIGDLLVLRLLGVLTLAEQQLINSDDAAKGRDLVKQVRTHLIEMARPMIAAMIKVVTGVQLISLHHDLSTTTGEECFVFTLATEPTFREVNKK